jgi:hypothetical protein
MQNLSGSQVLSFPFLNLDLYGIPLTYICAQPLNHMIDVKAELACSSNQFIAYARILFSSTGVIFLGALIWNNGLLLLQSLIKACSASAYVYTKRTLMQPDASQVKLGKPGNVPR